MSVTVRPVDATAHTVSITKQLVNATSHWISAIPKAFAGTVKRSTLTVACYAPSRGKPRDVQLGTAVYKKDYRALLNTRGGETFSFLMNLKE
ncbi:MAG TPA: hypothetical protein VNN25_12170 [Thermoanaerobaculia bacterium]|nr:hypothetical protein [Thermoanaerobaculia bacterium]